MADELRLGYLIVYHNGKDSLCRNSSRKERRRIYGLKESGISNRAIGLQMGYSKYTVLEKLPAKQAVPVREAVVARLKEQGFPVHTMTFDNGKELARHEEISLQLNTLCFFAKPYHSWERRLNEHTNGLVRQYFPKYTNIAMLLPEEVKNVENLLNDRLRKILNFQTLNEAIQNATR